MGDEMKIRANRGTKVEKSEIGDEKVGKLSATPAEDTEVEAQDYVDVQICPWCGAMGYGVEDEYSYRVYTCHCCGNCFRA